MNRVILLDMQGLLEHSLNWDVLRGKTVLITGAAGMLPSYMALALCYLNTHTEGEPVRILAAARNEEKLRRIFEGFYQYPWFRFLCADLAQGINCAEHVDYIIHGASNASSQQFTTDPSGTFLPNVIGTHALLELGRNHNVSGFLFLSSGEVYGKTQDALITEGTSGAVDPLLIRNCYAEGKRAGEMLCSIWHHQYGVPTKVARISHTFGPTMDFQRDGRVFAEFIRNILNNEDIVMKSDGSAVRPFCYLSDTTAALFYILLRGAPGEAYNVCNHNGYLSVLELAELLVSLYPEKGLKVVRQARKPDDAYVESKAGSEMRKTDNRKLSALGWEPKITVEEGLRRTVSSLSKPES